MTYDYIIAGGGGAGLSLLYRMLKAGLTEPKILLIDRERKTENDRTWSFWEAGEGLFEEQIHARWNHFYFHGKDFSKRLDIAPYTYKTLRGIDFYNVINARIDRAANVTRVCGEIEEVADTPTGGRVRVGSETYAADWIFSSIPQAPLDRTRPNYLDQHFKGWIVETEAPVFDPEAATFMDFRIPQCGETRFVYVLPFSERRAMIEFTIFGKELLAPAEYDEHLRDYIDTYLQPGSYRVVNEEFGVIPMTDQPLRERDGHVFYLGTAGGRVKTSTGYAFQRMQATNEAIVTAIRTQGSPARAQLPGAARFRFFDSILLNVLVRERLAADEVFTMMFRNNPAPQMLRFLSEESSWPEAIRIFWSVPSRPFIQAFLQESRAYWQERNALSKARMSVIG